MKRPKPITAIAIRTKMCGGGTAYDVYIPTSLKTYQPIVGHVYATVICRDGREYYQVNDFLRTKTIDALPPLTDERLNAFRRLQRVADRLAVRIAKRAFPELKHKDKLPMLWAQWTLESAETTIAVRLNERNRARLCE